MSKLKILQQDCDPTAAEDKSLPYTSYLVEYYDNGKRRFDLVVATNKSISLIIIGMSIKMVSLDSNNLKEL